MCCVLRRLVNLEEMVISGDDSCWMYWIVLNVEWIDESSWMFFSMSFFSIQHLLDITQQLNFFSSKTNVDILQVEKMHSNQILEVCRQICSALLFLHDQNLIHCYITSHAISLISPHQAKLGNFEYMMDRYVYLSSEMQLAGMTIVHIM